MLMLGEVDHLDIAHSRHLVPADEAGLIQHLQQCLNVIIVIGQHLKLNLQWPVLQPSFPIRYAPQSNKHYARRHRHGH